MGSTQLLTYPVRDVAASRGPLASILLALALVLAMVQASHADYLRVHGSTTFTRTLMEPFQQLIEAASGHQLAIIPNKTDNGLIDLLEDRADLAMISAPLEKEIAALRQTKPNLAYDSLQSFPIAETKVAFALHPANKVSAITRQELVGILSGTITNWSELGGANEPIKPVYVRSAGGVTSIIRSKVLEGKQITALSAIAVESPVQVAKVVQQEPGAIGLSQVRLIKAYELRELTAGSPILQRLMLVSKGKPTKPMMDVINAAREVAGTKLSPDT